MILEALSNNKNSYFPASLSKLVIMPMHEFKASSHPITPIAIFTSDSPPSNFFLNYFTQMRKTVKYLIFKFRFLFLN